MRSYAIPGSLLLLLLWGRAVQAGILCNMDDTVQHANTGQLQLTGSFSIVAWTKPVSFGTNSRGRILDKTGSSLGYTMSVDNANTTNGLAGGVNALSAPTSYVWGANTMTTGTPAHVVFTYNATGNVVALYVNGATVSQNTTSFTAGPSSGTQPLAICGRATDTSRSFDGVIEDVFLYNVTLSASQIRAFANSHLRSPAGLPQPLLHWPLNDCQHGATVSGTDFFKDRSGNGLHGTPSAGTGLTCDMTSIPLIGTGVW